MKPKSSIPDLHKNDNKKDVTETDKEKADVLAVIVNGFKSNPKDVTSGMPQGSVLGPTLFVLFIINLLDVIKHGIILYLLVDDTKIFHRV